LDDYDYEPDIDESFEIESALGSAGMGTDEYYRPATYDIDEVSFKRDNPPEEVHCSISDPEQFGFFSDLWKDDTGCRPRFFVTKEYVYEWLKARHDRKEAKDE
jgi:hypothetical protein